MLICQREQLFFIASVHIFIEFSREFKATVRNIAFSGKKYLKKHKHSTGRRITTFYPSTDRRPAVENLFFHTFYQRTLYSIIMNRMIIPAKGSPLFLRIYDSIYYL